MEKEQLYDKFWMFYYEKWSQDHDKAAQAIRDLDITELYVTDEPRVFIKLRRPGILIGMRGKNIENLKNFLGVKIHVEEEPTASVADQLIPYRGWDEVF